MPLYFVGDTPQGPRLFREFRSVPADNPLMEATALLLAGDTLDPDYRTLWPQVEISDVQATDGVLLVQIPGDGFTERPDGMSPRAAELAIQQLVYTLQGVQQERVPVVIKRGGTDFRLFGIGTDVAVHDREPLDVLGLVNITSPSRATSSPATRSRPAASASSFEATVPWEIPAARRSSLEGFATAEGWMDELLPVRETLHRRLEPRAGRPTVQCAAPTTRRGGAEGAGPGRGHQGLSRVQ